MTKQRKRIHIEGDEISSQELVRRLNRERQSFLEFEKEKIRINTQLDHFQKSSRTSEINWRLKQLKRELNR